jgi:hypothetical protein
VTFTDEEEIERMKERLRIVPEGDRDDVEIMGVE